jgi:NET1-associated nuclear protein 1 (U3 small nucleolar RNA-associated protein 17)
MYSLSPKWKIAETDICRHLVIAYHTSIQVYSATDSLLIRRIPITTLSSSETIATTDAEFIVAVKRSIQNPDFLWVMTLNGHVYHVNWTRTSTAPKGFKTSCKKAHDLVVAQSTPDAPEDTLLVLESDENGLANLNAYSSASTGDAQPENIFSMKSPEFGLVCLSANATGQVVCGAIGDRLFIASWETLDKEHCETFSFKVPDMISSLDVRVDERTEKHLKNKQQYIGSNVVVDVAIGGARGAIYRYSDLLAGLHPSEKAKAAKRDQLQAQKYHWHRRAVHAVKWSRDGKHQ